MMIGALLINCDCGVCDNQIPSLSESFTTLTKGFTANTKLNYANKNQFDSILDPPSPLYTAQTIPDPALGCIREPPVYMYELDCQGPLNIEDDFILWSPSPFPVEAYDAVSNNILSLNINSLTLAQVSWTRDTETTETILGGHVRSGSNTILVTGGIPIKRKTYNFLVNSPTGNNNTPSLSTSTYEEKYDCCCGCTTCDPIFERPCPTRTFFSVDPGSNSSRSISISDFNISDDYGQLTLKYPGVIDSTYHCLSVYLANNAANNARTWQFVSSSSGITFTSSDGNVIGCTGTLTNVKNTLDSFPLFFNPVVLGPNLNLTSGSTTFAEVADLPNYTSAPLQRGSGGITGLFVPLVFPGAISPPTTYQCGFYDNAGNPYFGANFSSVVGTFNYDQTLNGYLNYLFAKRHFYATTFNSGIVGRGLYLTNEYDSQLKFAEGNTWKIPSVAGICGSTVTKNYGISGYTSYFGVINVTLQWCGPALKNVILVEILVLLQRAQAHRIL